MDYYYLLTFRPLHPALLPQKNYLPKNQEKEKQKQKAAEKAGQQDQIILLQDLILRLPEAKDVLTMEISYMLAQEVAVIIIQETVSSM